MKSLRLLCLLLCWTAFADVKTITVLDRGEVHEAMVFHADHLWVGQSRKAFNADYKILVFDRKDEKVSEIVLNHSVQYLYPYDAKSVIAVGTGHTPNLTMYTIASPTSHRTVVIPVDAWANRWLGTLKGREYFSDPGGNPGDTTTDFSLPAQTLFRMEGNRPRYLPTRLRLPVGGLVVDDKLFVIQKENMIDATSNLAVVDPVTGKFNFAFTLARKNLSGIVKIPDSPLLAITERDANQVLLLDTKSLAVTAQVDAGQEPRAVTTLGRCVLVGSFSDRGIRVLERTEPGQLKVVADLANPLPETEFRRLFTLAADVKTGRIYGRSNFPCNPMTETCDQDFNRVISWDGHAEGVAKACHL